MILSIFGLLCVAAIVFVIVQYSRGYVPSFVYKEYETKDGSYRFVSIDDPYWLPLSAQIDGWGEGERVCSITYWTLTQCDAGYFDLNPDVAKRGRTDRLTGELRNWHKDQAIPPGATVEREAAVTVDTHEGLEVRWVQGNDRYVARYFLILNGSKPRAYWVSVGGPHFDPDGKVARKVLDSFRITPVK